MGVESERRFVLRPGKQFDKGTMIGTSIVQGYLCLDVERTVRVRIYGSKAYLTIKGKKDKTGKGFEFEYEIPFLDAVDLFNICVSGIIDKIRYKDEKFEYDVFRGDNEGLVILEIESKGDIDKTKVIPNDDWIEVTNDSETWSNLSLAKMPFIRNKEYYINKLNRG